MLEVFLFVVTVILVVVFWPIFVGLVLLVLGGAVAIYVVVLIGEYPEEAGAVALMVAAFGGILGLIWIVTQILDKTQVLDKAAERVGAFVGRGVGALRRAHQRTRLKGPDG